MKTSIRTIFGGIVVAALYHSLGVQGIRSAASLSSSSLDNNFGGDPSSRRKILLNTRGGHSSSESWTSEIPRESLPRALSGGQFEESTSVDEEEGGAKEVSIQADGDSTISAQASKWKDLATRVISAVGMIGFLALLAVYFKEDGLSVLVVLLQFMMFGEMTRTIGGDDWGSLGANLRKYWWFVTAVVAWDAPRVLSWKGVELEAIAMAMSVGVGVIGSVLSFQYNKSKAVAFREYIRQVAVSLLSATLVVLPSSFWIGTLEEHGMKWIFVPAALIAINDIMAYVFGRLVGKHPLLPAISPKKTWEGFAGAALSTVGTAYVALAEKEGASALVGPGLAGISRTDGMVLAAFASIVAPFAGFVASFVKRAYGRKDFGDTFPGHGGFVDRLDCQLITAPFVYFYLSLYKAAAATSS